MRFPDVLGNIPPLNGVAGDLNSQGNRFPNISFNLFTFNGEPVTMVPSGFRRWPSIIPILQGQSMSLPTSLPSRAEGCTISQRLRTEPDCPSPRGASKTLARKGNVQPPLSTDLGDKATSEETSSPALWSPCRLSAQSTWAWPVFFSYRSFPSPRLLADLEVGPLPF